MFQFYFKIVQAIDITLLQINIFNCLQISSDDYLTNIWITIDIKIFFFIWAIIYQNFNE